MRTILVVSLLPAAACSEEAQAPPPATVRETPSATPESPQRREIVFRDGSTVTVEVAADPATRAQGLMFRPSLSPDRGMLFLFPDKARHAFWMKNTLIPLDILWLDEAGAVVHIEREVPPCQADPCPSYAPEGKATRVLELAADQAAARGVRIGDVLELRGGLENIVAR